MKRGKFGLSPRVALIAAVWAFATPSHATDFAKTGPLAPATQILAARDSVDAPLLVLTYDVTSDDAPARAVKIDIASDYVAIDEGAEITLFDYRLKRFMRIERATKSFSNNSLYALVDFRFRESFNRRVQRKMLAQLKSSAVPRDLTNPFWAQSELRVVDPTDEPSGLARTQDANGTVHFSVDGEEVTRYELSGENLAPGETSGFVHFLLEGTQLHPSIVTEIASSGRVPKSFSVVASNAARRSHSLWVLKSSARTRGTFPLPADYNPIVEPETAGSDIANALPTMLDAVALRSGTGPRPASEYQAAIDDALSRGAILESYVLDNEFFLQYGLGITGCANHTAPEASCAREGEVAAKWESDPRTSQLLHSFVVEEQGDIKQAIALRGAIPHDDIRDAYMFDIWIGNSDTESGNLSAAIPLLQRGLKGNPYVASFYKDLGDAMKDDFDSFDAWTSYDLGRCLPGRDTAPVVGDIAKIEQALEQRYPQFF